MTVREFRNKLSLFPDNYQVMIESLGIFNIPEIIRDRDPNGHEPRDVAIIELNPYAFEQPEA